MDQHELSAAAKLRYLASEFYRECEALEAAHATLADARRCIEGADARIETLRAQLAASVQPQCGSATKPHRRIFTWGERKRCVLVQWDAALRQPVVSLEVAETA